MHAGDDLQMWLQRFDKRKQGYNIISAYAWILIYSAPAWILFKSVQAWYYLKLRKRGYLDDWKVQMCGVKTCMQVTIYKCDCKLML